MNKFITRYFFMNFPIYCLNSVKKPLRHSLSKSVFTLKSYLYYPGYSIFKKKDEYYMNVVELK